MKKILIVEDESVVAWDIQESLEKLGYTVIASVTSGVEAVQIPTAIKPDLVLMDILLEGEIDGVAAAEQIRDRFNIPVVYLTAHADTQTLQRALSTNPYGYLVKPFQERELYTTLEIALRRHQLELRNEQTKQWLFTTLVSLGEATIATDCNGYITFMNPVAEILTGWQHQEVIGKAVGQILPLFENDKGGVIENLLAQAMHRGTAVSLPQTCLLHTQDGTEIPISPTAAPIRNKEGKIIGCVMICHNAIERTQVEASQRLLEGLSQKIQRSLQLDDILKTTASELRELLDLNRVIIYRSHADGSGSVVVESLAAGLTPMLGWEERQPWIANPTYFNHYHQGQIQAIDDIYAIELKQEQVQFLEFFNIRSQLTIPLLKGEQLWGLLIGYDCVVAKARSQWQIDWLKQLATQVSIAIQQAELSAELERTNQKLYEELERTNQKLQDLALIDSLTKLKNRRYFDECLEQEWKRLAMEEIPLSLILCDIDFFKTFNELYGHQAGDDCLQQVSRAICQSVVRSTDLVARYGGEEFAIMLPHTNADAAVWIAQKMRGTVKRLKIAHAGSLVNRHVTLSFGVACATPHLKSSPKTLVAVADQALYQAKEQGRDRVVLWGNVGYDAK